ncbi:MAG: dihydropteroate synthase [Verrucomicrobiia bacterium]
MGIVNITHDSFSGDGTLDPTQALRHAREMISSGADLIDVGGESARTNREAIAPEVEIDRVRPFIENFASCWKDVVPRDAEQIFPPLLSLNTWRPKVVEALLPSGVDLLNDMGGLPTPENAELCAAHRTALLIMHTQGAPKQAMTHVIYQDIGKELVHFFQQKILMAEVAGLARQHIVLDPGLDFAKQRDDNLAILANLDQWLRPFQMPILLPVSRKTVIGEVLHVTDPAMRDAGTVALVALALRSRVSIVRVHHVNAAWLALKTLSAVAMFEAGR